MKMYISQREIAKRLGVVLPTVNRWVERGYLPSVRIAGVKRILRAQFEEWYQALHEKGEEELQRLLGD